MIGEATEARTENPMAATWTQAAIVRRAFRAGPRRKTDLVYDVERGFLECRILYIELRNAMIDAGIKTSASDVAVGIVLTDGSNRKAYVLPAGGSLEEFTEWAKKAERLEKRHNVIPVGAGFWQRDRESCQDETWVRLWRVDGETAILMTDIKKELKQEKGDYFETVY
jgi:hypothetical protein